MIVDDIAGTKSRRFIKGVAKNILSNADIDGSSPKLDKVQNFINCFQLKPKPYDLLDYRDVNGKKKYQYSTSRDPLNPVYVYTRPNGDVYQYG